MEVPIYTCIMSAVKNPTSKAKRNTNRRRERGKGCKYKKKGPGNTGLEINQFSEPSEINIKNVGFNELFLE